MASYNIPNTNKMPVRLEIELTKDNDAYVADKIDDMMIDSITQKLNDKKKKDINDNYKGTDENENTRDIMNDSYDNNDCNILLMKQIHVFKK